MKKRSGKELDQKTIREEFSAPLKTGGTVNSTNPNPNSELDILSSYISTSSTKNGTEKVSVDFLNQSDLDHFLMNGSRKEAGILQRFIIPKGQKNSVVQAIWSPHVTLVERRTNDKKLFDTKFPVYDRAVTYEGPTHYSSEVFVAPQLVKHIKKICQNIVNHFEETEHKKISRMVLYFKVDANDNIWLLWSSSIRIMEPKSKTSSRPNAPLNLSPSFAQPDTLNKAPSNKPSQLTDNSATKKSSFGATITQPKKKKSVKTTDTQSTTPFLCPNCGKKRTGPRHALPLHVILDAYKEDIKSVPSPRRAQKKTPGKSNTETIKMTRVQKLIIEKLDDLLYEAYSHFLHSNEPFRFSLPSELEPEQLQELKEGLVKLGVQENSETELQIQHHTVSIGKLHKEFETFKRLLSSSTRSGEDKSNENLTQENLQEDLENKGDDQRNDAVPPSLLKFLPHLTNLSYRELRKEPLFMSRPVPVCEPCMLLVTNPAIITKKTTGRPSTSSQVDKLGSSRKSQLGSTKKKTTKSGTSTSYKQADDELFQDLDDFMEKL